MRGCVFSTEIFGANQLTNENKSVVAGIRTKRFPIRTHCGVRVCFLRDSGTSFGRIFFARRKDRANGCFAPFAYPLAGRECILGRGLPSPVFLDARVLYHTRRRRFFPAHPSTVSLLFSVVGCPSRNEHHGRACFRKTHTPRSGSRMFLWVTPQRGRRRRRRQRTSGGVGSGDDPDHAQPPDVQPRAGDPRLRRQVEEGRGPVRSDAVRERRRLLRLREGRRRRRRTARGGREGERGRGGERRGEERRRGAGRGRGDVHAPHRRLREGWRTGQVGIASRDCNRRGALPLQGRQPLRNHANPGHAQC